MRALIRFILGLLFLSTGCASRPSDAVASDNLLVRIDQSISSGRNYLLGKQGEDGAFRSGTYGFMKDGSSLTPHVLACLKATPQSPARDDALRRGGAFLIELARGDLKEANLIFPAYTAADAMIVLDGMGSGAPESRDRYHAYLLSHRLNGPKGWSSADLEFGGWGYALQPSVKPTTATRRGPWDFSNLSATVAALRALHASGLPPNEAMNQEVLLLVKRCQNFPDGDRKSAFDDGGFFFSPAEPIRNKAGRAGVDAGGRERFHSYGSMTADGALALLLLGLPEDDPRVLAATSWLTRSFSPERNPGLFSPETEDLRNATYFYYCRSAAELFVRLADRKPLRANVPADWAQALSREILNRQRPDGSWSNPSTDAREDDPLVSTPLALHALLACRRELAR